MGEDVTCEFCMVDKAEHFDRGDWHLCKRCYRNRSYFEWVAVAFSLLILVVLAWLFVSRV